MTKRVEERPQPFGEEAANRAARRFAILALWPAGAAISRRGSRARGAGACPVPCGDLPGPASARKVSR